MRKSLFISEAKSFVRRYAIRNGVPFSGERSMLDNVREHMHMRFASVECRKGVCLSPSLTPQAGRIVWAFVR